MQPMSNFDLTMHAALNTISIILSQFTFLVGPSITPQCLYIIRKILSG